jgi:hypothetical protein
MVVHHIDLGHSAGDTSDLASRGARFCCRVRMVAVTLIIFLRVTSAYAADDFMVTNCPGGAPPPLPFEIYCSNVNDLAAKQLCRPFIENQACKVFPAYREITGINLEKTCHSMKYTIYDKSRWPYQGGDAGGLAMQCAVAYLPEYSIDANAKSNVGPYETHELLHEYQNELGALPYVHILFGSSQAEALRLIGDASAYEKAVADLRQETGQFEERLQKFKPNALVADTCILAEIQLDETLYLNDPKSVYAYYRTLVRSRVAALADREARFNRMFDAVSNGQSNQFLIAHGCTSF